MTVAGCVTAAAKGVITNLFMVGSLKLHPMDLLTYTSTLSAVQLLAVVVYNGELQEALNVRGPFARGPLACGTPARGTLARGLLAMIGWTV
jgi:hypothetical protein